LQSNPGAAPPQAGGRPQHAEPYPTKCRSNRHSPYSSRGGVTALDTAKPTLAALSSGAERLAAGTSTGEALQAVADAVQIAAGAEVAVIRIVEGGELAARAVAGPAFLVAELEGSRLAAPVPEEEVSKLDRLSPESRAVARRAKADSVLVLPVRADGVAVAALELLRSGPPFTGEERAAARIAVAQVGLVLRAFAGSDDRARSSTQLELVAEALGAGADEARNPDRIARLAAAATGADACLIWRAEDQVQLEPVVSVGSLEPATNGALAGAARRAGTAPAIEEVGGAQVASLPLGQPPIGVLQLVFFAAAAPAADLTALGGFASRAAQALRAGERAGAVRRELDRTRDLLSVVGEATAQLSLAHTLDTALDRVPDLLGVGALGVYLRLDRKLETAAAREVTGPHAAVAEHLLELALGPFRARGLVAFPDAAHDRHLAPVRAALGEAGIEAAHAVPLLVHGDVIGLLAVYPSRGRELQPDQAALLTALAGQIAVAVQNARLHEETTQLGAEREQALEAERVAARRLSALYEISRSFAQSLSLDDTLDAVGRTLVELLDVDAAVIRLPDERGESLVAQAVHVSSPQLLAAFEAVFSAPEQVVPSAARRRLAEGRPVQLDAITARELSQSHRLLVPFLERGSTAAVVPIATPSEVLATLTLVSLDPGRPITDETLDIAASVAAQAALAVDNARLYQQQKAFTDSMQRSLLPRSRPAIPALEFGAVYESSALLGVGGDVYDYVQIDADRLAIVLGDVTGHGIDAAADMAMAKFVFRSLARLYPEPSAFLAAANDVVVEEIGPGKFITMLYLVVDLRAGEVACASGGHPPPRLVHPDGRVKGLDATGLVLGIEPGQPYEELRRRFDVGDAVVLYTDGVVEARRAGELFGEARLDATLAQQHGLQAQALAEAALDECRRFVGGELRDDCAIVVVRRL
jgi:serine phosphatase RsbU (regulator of sigma subunit)